MEVLTASFTTLPVKGSRTSCSLLVTPLYRLFFPTVSYLSVHLPSYVNTHRHANSSMLTSLLPFGFSRNFTLVWDPNGPSSDLILRQYNLFTRDVCWIKRA